MDKEEKYIGLDGNEYTREEFMKTTFINIGGYWGAGPDLTKDQLRAMHAQGNSMQPIETVQYMTVEQIIERYCDNLSDQQKAQIEAMREAVPKFKEGLIDVPLVYGTGEPSLGLDELAEFLNENFKNHSVLIKEEMFRYIKANLPGVIDNKVVDDFLKGLIGVGFTEESVIKFRDEYFQWIEQGLG